MLQDGRVTAGHARAVVGRHDATTLAQQIIARDLSVREVEAMLHSRTAKPARPRAKPETGSDPDTIALEHELSALLGLKVTINFDGKGGKLSVHYTTLDQLDDVLQRLNQSPRTVN